MIKSLENYAVDEEGQLDIFKLCKDFNELGLDENTVIKSLKKLVKKGVLASSELGNKNYYNLNPYLFTNLNQGVFWLTIFHETKGWEDVK